MLKSLNKLGVYIFLLILMSCTKDNNTLTISTPDIHIINDSGSALAARVVVSLNSPKAIEINCYISGSSKVVYSYLTSENKQHSIPLLKLKENTEYDLEINILDSQSKIETIEKRRFTTASIPSWITEFYNPDSHRINDPLEGYYLFANMSNPGCIYLIDNTGELVWYQTTEGVVKNVQITDKGTVLSLIDQNGTNFGDGNIVLERSLAGDTIFYLKQGQKGFDKTVHHDLAVKPNGNILAITNTFQDGFPGDGIVEWSSSGNKVWEWSTFDVKHEIDPNIIEQPWINSIFIDHDQNYILSLRSLNQVWKVHSKTGEVIWKLGERGNINFETPFTFIKQHYAYRNHSGDLMLFDNGSEDRPYTRVVSFEVDEVKRTAQTKSIIDLPTKNYSPIMGNGILLPDNNILVASSSSHTALKLDLSGKVLFELNFKSPIYRIEYLNPDLFIPK